MLVSIDRRCIKLLQELEKETEFVSIKSLSESLDQTRRQTQYDIYKINSLFEFDKLPPIEAKQHKGVRLMDVHREWLKDLLDQENKKEDSEYNYVLTQEERCAVIICENVLRNGFSTLDDLSEQLMVSKNTIFIDMKIVREKLKEYNIKCEFISGKGYLINGEELEKRKVFMYYISSIYGLISDGMLDYLQDEDVKRHIEVLHKIEEELEVHYNKGIIEKLALMLHFSETGENTKWNFPQKTGSALVCVNIDHVCRSHVYGIIDKYMKDRSDDEKAYICIHLLAGRMNKEYYLYNETEEIFEELAEKLVGYFETLVGVTMDKRGSLIEDLTQHLSRSSYRYIYGINDGSELETIIRREAEELFNVVRKVADRFSHDIQCPIDDQEVAYLAVHFSSHMHRTSAKKYRYSSMLICDESEKKRENLKKRIEDNIPLIQVHEVLTKAEYVNTEKNKYEVVISTEVLDINDGYVLISKKFDNTDHINILNEVLQSRADEVSSLSDDLFDQIKPYIQKKQVGTVRSIVDHFFGSDQNSTLAQLLTRERVKCLGDKDVSLSWRDAVFQAAYPLLADGSINRHYIDSIILNVELYGAYFYFDNGVYLTHAKDTSGVFRSGVSVMTIPRGINFPHNKKIYILFVLASVDEKEHFGVLKEILKVCDSKEKTEWLLEAQNEDVLYKNLRMIAEKK